MGQFVPRENPLDGAERPQGRNAHVLQLPEDSLSTAEDFFVVEVETDKLHDLLDFIRRSVGAVFRTPGGALFHSSSLSRCSWCFSPLWSQALDLPTEAQMDSGFSPLRKR